MLTDSLYTPSQFLHSPLESEPDVLAVLMGERRLRCFMLMLSVGLGPAFPMNLNKGSRKFRFQAFDRLVPVQKQRGSTLCILAYSSPAGFSLLIVLSCAFIFYREKVSLCWKETLWTKWGRTVLLCKDFLLQGLCFKKRGILDITLNLMCLNYLASTTSFCFCWLLICHHHPFLVSLIMLCACYLHCRGNVISFCTTCWSLEAWLSPRTSGGHWHCTGVKKMGLKGSSCLLLSRTLHWLISSGCMHYSYLQSDLQEILLLKLLT